MNNNRECYPCLAVVISDARSPGPNRDLSLRVAIASEHGMVDWGMSGTKAWILSLELPSCYCCPNEIRGHVRSDMFRRRLS
jgi:hypothetical protein